VADLQFLFGQPFEEQLAFFRRKLNLPTQAWDDILGEAHDKAFVVAGVTRADVLNDLRAAVDDAIAKGEGLPAFQKRFREIMRNRGWTNFTGSGSRDGIAWRARIIYETNMRTSYAAGRWQQMTQTEELEQRPFWRYVHTTVENPRLDHKSWDGLILPAKHPWFESHFPPNGWGCNCRVDSLALEDLADYGKSGPDQPPNDGEVDYVVPSTGEVVRLPKGVQHGFNYAPGASVVGQAMQVALRKAATLPPVLASLAVGSALSNAPILAALEQTLGAWVQAVLAAKQSAGLFFDVGVVNVKVLAALEGLGITLDSAVVRLTDEGVIHITRLDKQKSGTGVSAKDMLLLPMTLHNPQAVLFDTEKQNLVYVFDSNIQKKGQKAKWAVSLNYTMKERNPQTGSRNTVTVNRVATAGLVAEFNLREQKYQVLDGKL
jgi:hypothetical protein